MGESKRGPKLPAVNRWSPRKRPVERQVERPFQRPVDALRSAIDWTIVGAFGVVLGVGMARHEPWRDELQAWMIARASRTPGQLVRNLQHEGHPIGWYALLWPFARAVSSVWMLQLIAWCVSVSTAALVMARAPWSRLTRALIIFGYFFVFEYGVLARSYALGLLCLLGALTSMRPRYRWVPLGIALAALSLTSAFGAIIAAALLIGAVVDQRQVLRSLEVRRRLSMTASLLASAAIASWIQARPRPSTASFNTWNFSKDSHLASTAIAAIFRGIVPLPRLQHSWWNTSIADGHTGIAAIAGIALLVSIAWAFRTSPAALTVWTLGTVSVVGLLYLKLRQADAARYYGHIFMLLIAAAWIHAEPTPAAVESEVGDLELHNERRGMHPRKRPTRWFAILLAGQCAFGLVAVSIDVANPFTDAQSTAAWIVTHGGKHPGIIGCDDAATSSVAGHLNRRIFYRQGAVSGTFIEWNRRRRHDFANLATAVRRASAGTRSLVLYVSNHRVDALTKRLRFTARNGIVADEHYWVYDLTTTTEAELTAPALRGQQDPCRTL